jgi:hypothetical protein
VLMSWPIGFAESSAVRIMSICPFPRRSPDRAIGDHLFRRV